MLTVMDDDPGVLGNSHVPQRGQQQLQIFRAVKDKIEMLLRNTGEKPRETQSRWIIGDDDGVHDDGVHSVVWHRGQGRMVFSLRSWFYTHSSLITATFPYMP